LPDAVDPSHAPIGTTEAERLVFAQIYEPLLQRDCAGVLTPGLAEDWRRWGDSGWRLRLRPGARFSDATVASGSTVAAALAGAAPQWGVAPLGDRDLVIQARGDRRLPGALAEARWAIAKAGGAGQWPASTLGTITSAAHGITFTRRDAVIAFTWPGGADARDLLEGGADAVLTDQPAALEYAAVRAAFDAIPLPWSRTYVVVVPPGGGAPFADGGGGWRDAVRGEARPAVAPFWWASVKCDGAPPAPLAATGSPRAV
jgi:hypothetical protein